jgi:hypothetical protein
MKILVPNIALKMWGWVEIWCSPNTLQYPQKLFLKNTLPWWRVFNLAKKNNSTKGICGDIPFQPGLVNNLSGIFWDMG